jgi:hypothetical protein
MLDESMIVKKKIEPADNQNAERGDFLASIRYYINLLIFRNFSKQDLGKKKRKQKKEKPSKKAPPPGNNLMASLFEKIQLRRRAIENKEIVITKESQEVEKIEIPEIKNKKEEKKDDENEDEEKKIVKKVEEKKIEKKIEKKVEEKKEEKKKDDDWDVGDEEIEDF